MKYKGFLKELRGEIDEGRENVLYEKEREEVALFWRVGMRLVGYLKGLEATKETEATEVVEEDWEGFFLRVSGDLSVELKWLYLYCLFYLRYPNLDPTPTLSWGHYRFLNSVKDIKDEDKIQSKAEIDALARRTFAKIKRSKVVVKHTVGNSKQSKIKKIKGKLYTYKLIKTNHSNGLMIDCGFSTYYQTDQLITSKSKFIETTKTKTNYKIASSTARTQNIYTYKAFVERVIDGDTIVVTVDCGFNLMSNQTLRFRGIDTPRVGSVEGKKARQFVMRALKDLPFIIIKTYKKEKYGRYLADIYYQKNELNPQTILSQGHFLNQQLLEKHLAKKFY